VEFPHEIHDNFNNYQDTILLVDKGENKFQALGHDLMHNHPYAEQRFARVSQLRCLDYYLKAVI
jgi:diphosphomevalonate decarboxylase